MDLRHSILAYLYPHKDETELVELNEFLLTLTPLENQKILEPILTSLEKEGLVYFAGMIGYIGQTGHENDSYRAKLKSGGIQRYSEYVRIISQENLIKEQAESIIKLNKATEDFYKKQKGFLETQEQYFEKQDNYNRAQRNLTRLLLGSSLAYTIISLLLYIHDIKQTTETQDLLNQTETLKHYLNKHLQNDSISLKSISDSLRK